FQAEDGIRYRNVTGVQTCALPICSRYIKRLEAANVQVGAFFPSRFAKINLRINFRNHRKLAIIDGEVGYIGGFNIGDEYLGKSEKFGYWRDTHLRVKGDALKMMQTRFI